jgi:hypothetical protein
MSVVVAAAGEDRIRSIMTTRSTVTIRLLEILERRR